MNHISAPLKAATFRWFLACFEYLRENMLIKLINFSFNVRCATFSVLGCHDQPFYGDGIRGKYIWVKPCQEQWMGIISWKFFFLPVNAFAWIYSVPYFIFLNFVIVSLEVKSIFYCHMKWFCQFLCLKICIFLTFFFLQLGQLQKTSLHMV